MAIKKRKVLKRRTSCIYQCGNEVREAGMICKNCRRWYARKAAKADFLQRKAMRRDGNQDAAESGPA